MACCKKESCEEVKLAMFDFGFSNEEVNDLVQNHGQDVLSILTNALRLGLTKQFVVETLTQVGPYLLQLILSVVTKKQQLGIADATENVVDGVLVDSLIKRLLPGILEKYGDQLANLVVEAILSYLKKLSN